MKRRRRGGFVIGIILVLVGGFYLAKQFVPGLENWYDDYVDWPMIIIGIGLLQLLIALAGQPDMAVSAAVVGGVGGILFYQNATGDWESWAYVWALIPGFTGVGTILAGLLKGRLRRELSGGLWLIFISAVMFSIAATYLGGPEILGDWWPILLILWGVGLLVRNFIPRRSRVI